MSFGTRYRTNAPRVPSVRKPYHDAYVAGALNRLDCSANASLSDNPHAIGTIAYDAWRDGYLDTDDALISNKPLRFIDC
jgi:hypothetical protein